MKFEKANVLITGGASGIGRIMGRMALEKGAAALIIWDINPQNISDTVKEMSKLGRVRGYIVDVSKNELVTEAYNKVINECGQVDILINCAGIVTSNKTFDKMSSDEIVRTMNINTLAPMFVARAMLPDMIRRDRGHICTIASAGGMLSNPKMSVYAASKYGVKSRIIPILKPEYVAKRVIRAIERNSSFRGIPFGFHFIRFWQAVLPTRVFDWFFGKVFGIYHAMDDFTGRRPSLKASGKAS